MKTKKPFNSSIVFIYQLKFKLLILFIISNFVFVNAQSSCSADMSVVKGRNSRSTTSSGTFYKMTITNKGGSTDLYNLTSINNNGSCTNTDGSSTASNVNLIVSFKDLNLNDITKITVRPQETIEFYANVNVPVGTLINKWCCSKITAKSDTCTSYSINTDLHTLVINANE